MDDSWRDSYDAWKLASPYDDYDDDPREDCDHDEYEVDWEGRAECHLCGTHWWLTAEQLEAHKEAEADYMAEYDRMCRREASRFCRTVDRLTSFVRHIRLPQRKKASPIVDDIPF